MLQTRVSRKCIHRRFSEFLYKRPLGMGLTKRVFAFLMLNLVLADIFVANDCISLLKNDLLHWGACSIHFYTIGPLSPPDQRMSAEQLVRAHLFCSREAIGCL